MLTKLSDLDKEADTQRKTKQDLELDNRRLKIEIAKLQNTRNETFDKAEFEKQLKSAWQEGFDKAEVYYVNQYVELQKTVEKRFIEIKKLADACILPIEVKLNNYLPSKTPPNLVKFAPRKETLPTQNIVVESTTTNGNGQVKAGVMTLLQYAAMFYPNAVSKRQLSTMAGFTAGTCDVYLGQLVKLTWIEVSDSKVTITTEGMRNAGDYKNLPTDSRSILNLWLPKFKQGASKILQLVFDSMGGINKYDLISKTGFTAGTLDVYLGQLRQNDLIELSGDKVTLSESFFPLQKVGA